MKAMLLLYGDEAAWQAMTPAEIEESIKPYFAYTQLLRERGKLVHANELSPSSAAKSVTLAKGGRVWDGPFSDTKEQLGGYYLLEVASMDEAVELARLCPQAATGVVEVRPVIEHDG